MSHDNCIIEIEIVLAIKKIEVLGLITFRNYSTPQEIQNFIKVLRPKTFKTCSTPQKIQKFNFWEKSKMF